MVRWMFMNKKVICVCCMVLMMGGCSKEEVVESLPQHNEKEEIVRAEKITLRKEASKLIEDMEPVSADEVFKNDKKIGYPKGVNFTPTFINDDGVLFGEGDYSSNRQDLFLAGYDLFHEQFKELEKMRADTDAGTIGIVTANEDIVIYEEYDVNREAAQYYVYNLETKEIHTLYALQNVSQLHYNQAFIADDGIMLNFYNKEDEVYHNYFYAYDTNQLTLVEDRNCGYPIKVQDVWYYLLIDNENARTSVIRYEFEDNKKEVVFETEGQERFISGLYSNKEDILLMLNVNEMTECYKVDGQTLEGEYVFESDWIESVSYHHNYVTWLGTNYLEDRIRPQYHLFDIASMTYYENADGVIFLSDKTMARIEYKKSDAEIMKGGIYTDDNTCISVVKY